MMSNNKTELLPCPFCGKSQEHFHHYSTRIGFDVYYVIRCFCGGQAMGWTDQEAAKIWNSRPAPPEDVRTVVEEPVATVATMLKHSIPMFLNGFFQPSIAITDKVAMFSVDLPAGTKLYRHPQRPMVLPERDAFVVVKPIHIPADVNFFDGRVAQIGWNACLDRIAELNK